MLHIDNSSYINSKIFLKNNSKSLAKVPYLVYHLFKERDRKTLSKIRRKQNERLRKNRSIRKRHQ